MPRVSFNFQIWIFLYLPFCFDFEFFRVFFFFWQCVLFDSKKIASIRSFDNGKILNPVLLLPTVTNSKFSCNFNNIICFAQKSIGFVCGSKSLGTSKTEFALTAERWDWMNELFAPDSILNIIVFLYNWKKQYTVYLSIYRSTPERKIKSIRLHKLE